MSLLKSLKPRKAPATIEAAPAQCEHWELAPRWGDAASIGKKELITHYTCASCGANLSPDAVADRR
jgi:hypothetical protein